MEKAKNNLEHLDEGEDLSLGIPEQQKEKVKEKFLMLAKMEI